MQWTLKSFNELTVPELYAILQLRCRVFILEQNCPYLDEDDKDQYSYHLMGYKTDLLMAYTRILPSGLAFDEPSIGRVVTSPMERGTGLGRDLMKRSIEALYSIYGAVPIRIGAQLYLKNFYDSFGFQQASDVYLEDGIRHIEMLKAVS